MSECLRVLHLRFPVLAALIALASFGVLPTCATAQSGASAFTTIDVTGAGTAEFEGTVALGIDTAGDSAGTYLDANGIAHGFIRAAAGAITTYTAPLAGISGVGSTTGGKGTFFTSMDSAGDIAGYYSDANNLYHALFLTAGSTAMTYFDDPSAAAFGHLGTAATAINASGVVTGFYRDANLVYHGYVRAANGTFTQLDVSGAGTASSQGTEPLSMNSAGVITGRYIDSNFAVHGFVRAVGGAITTFDPSGVATGPFTQKTQSGTFPLSINAAGVIAGAYADANHVDHLFVRSASGTITEFDAPGEGGTTCTALPQYFICGTGGLSIDTAGDITGTYADANGILHGFLRAADTGNITSFDAPGAGSASTFEGTGGLGINATGTIAGTYIDTNVAIHGFIYTPSLAATTAALSPAPAPNPSVYEEPVTLSATVTSSSGAPPNGESVTFMSGAAALGTAQLTSGAASLTTTALQVGSDSITAVYAGDTDFSGSTSTAVTQVVGEASTSTTLTSSQNPSNSGQSVTFKATVAGQFSGIATGTVTFSNGSTNLGTATLSGGAASLAITSLPVGVDSIEASYSGDANFTASSSSVLTQVVNALAPAATPTFSVPAGTYTAAQTVTISDATTGATIYYTTNGNPPTTGSSAYNQPVTVSSSETLEAIATASGYSTSAVASAAYVINIASNPAPAISGTSPAFTNAGGTAFTLIVNGSGFTASSAVYWGTSALTTTYVSATQLSAQVSATDIATGGIAVSITVVTPSPGGGTSNAFQFEVDSASGSTTGPTFTSTTATVTAGSSATYPVTLPSGVTGATVSCLNLPTGAACSYSSTTGVLTISTTSATPAGTYQVTAVFSETVTGAAFILLPFLLIPLVILRKRLAAQGVWITACLGLVLLAAAAFNTGCGGGGSSSTAPPQTHQVTTSGAVTLIVH
jgi:hypothetical protein